MKKILVIDDNNDNLITIKAVIENHLKNCKVLTALSGEEGVKIAQKELPDTILLDIVMPGMDGFEVCKQLKENNLTKHIPVIIVTAVKIDTASKVKGLNLGADAFISKPIDSIELSAQINVMLRIKEAEDKLREEKEQLDKLVSEKTKENQYQATVLANVTDPVIFTNMDNTIVSWNKAAEKLYGYEEKEVIGKLYSEILKPEYPDKSREEIWNELNTLGVVQGEIVHYKKDGTRIIITGSVSFVKDVDGENIGTVSVNHDITKHKEALDISLKLSLAINNSKEVVFLTDKEGIITFVNPEFTRLYGYTADDVVGKVTPRILKSNTIDKKAVVQMWNLLLNKESIPPMSYVNKHKDGTLINIEGSADSILDDNNEIIGFLGIQRDITERVKKEDKINEQSEFLNKTIESLTIPFYVVNASDYSIELSNSAAKVPAYIENIKCYQLAHEGDKPCDGVSHPCTLQLVKKTKKPCFVEHIHFDMNGKPRNVEVHGYPIFDKNENVVQMIEYCLDITEKVEALGKLKKQAIFTMQNPAPVFSTDLQGIIHEVNQAAENISQHIKIGTNVCSIFNYFEKSSLESITETNHIQIEEAIGGNTYLFTIKKNATTKQIYFFGTNITQLKETRQDLITALERATESDRIKSAFLATMSHELRTPLNAIIGFSDLINQEMTFNDVLDYNKLINVSGKQLLSIVQNIFTITLIEVGEVDAIKENHELIPILNNVHEIIKIDQISARKHHIDIKLNIPPNTESLKINTDLPKFKQILINLLKNAIKFTHEGVINYGFTIEKDAKSSTIKFYVEDTGIGIPKDKHEIIFENFRQADETYTRMYGGIGVGLSIAKKLTKLLGGKLWLNSVVGKGSTFYFTIPYEEIIVQEQTRKSVVDAHAKNDKNTKDKTVLIVEDDFESSEFLKVVMEVQLGMKTQFAKNGKEAITACEENPNIDLILMDINMPIMNGYEATGVIKKLRPNLPIIAQTAYAIFGDREKSLKAGCDNYISKPINKEELMEKIYKAMNA